jgi:hypothetical protein
MYRFKIKVVPFLELEHPFRQGKDGWLGGDCAFSLPLSKERVLWLFGDSFIQDKNLLSRKGAAFINNSIAIQQGSLLNGDHSIHFYWNNEDSNPRAFFETENDQGFLWPLSAVLIGEKLFVFCVRIEITDPEKIFGFKQIGNEIFCIENPDDQTNQWKMNVHKLQFQRHLGGFGSNFLFKEDYLYIYGYRNSRTNWNNAIINFIIARIRVDQSHEIYDLKNWEYLDGATGKWYKDIYQMKPVIEYFTTEYSVTFLPEINKYILVANAWNHPHPITIRFSDTPFGIFSEPQIVYHCPEIEWSSNYFCYAAKAHPELAEQDNELVISYMTNSKVLQECIDDLRIYFPRFVKILFHE